METEYLRRAREGDTVAYEYIVRLYETTVFRLAYLLIGDADEAQDIAQDSFLQAYRALARFDLERPFRPWLLRITANLARNRRRSIGRYWKMVQRIIRDEPPAISHAEEDTTRRQEAQELWAAVQHLKESDREVIYLRFFLELSIVETAEVLQIEQGTVKSRLHRALHRLREVIQREYPQLREGRVSHEA